MKVYFLLSLLLSARLAQAANCIDLSGKYLLPQLNTEAEVMTVKQVGCETIELDQCTQDGSICEMPIDGTLDGRFSPGCVQDCESFKAGPKSILEKPKFASSLLTRAHGACSYQQSELSLDANGNLVRSARVSSCEDKYSGAYSETWKKL